MEINKLINFISALWQYIKTHKLQDPNEREYVNCDPFLRQIFQTERMKFAEIPQRLNPLLHPPDPIVINHLITGTLFRSKRFALNEMLFLKSGYYISQKFREMFQRNASKFAIFYVQENPHSFLPFSFCATLLFPL